MSTSKLAAMAFLLAPATVVGQEPGDSVRISLAGEEVSPVEGLLVSAGDSLYVTTKSGSRSVPASEAQRIDVYRGTRGNAGKGFIIGAAAGAVGGALLGIAVNSAFCSEWSTDCSPGPVAAAAGGALLLAVPAGAIGALVGWVNRSPVWEPADLPGESGVTVVPAVDPSTGAMSLSLSLPVR